MPTTRSIKRYLFRLSHCLVLVIAWLPIFAWAQAGPPLITNDPDTPGDGNWEINLAATGAHQPGNWDLAAPDLDINYGFGERIQLSMHMPWNHQRDTNGHWQSGVGPIELAIRWRFVDEEKAGFSMAIQPHWISSGTDAAVRRGLAPANEEFVLPIQAAKQIGEAKMGVEISRHFIRHENNEWQAGVFWSHDCLAKIQCLAEINTLWPADARAETIVNFGARKNVNEHLILLGSFGRQITGSSERQQFLFYFGVQILR